MSELLCTHCSAKVRPVVVLDIDGTLGDYHGHFHNFAEGYLGRELRPGYDGSVEMHDWYGLGLEEYRAIKLAYRQGAMKRTMPLFDGAWSLCQLLDDLGCEVWIATTRPYLRLDNIDPDTREWLGRHGIKYDGLVYGDDKYQHIVDSVQPRRIVAVLDDLPVNIRAARALGLRAVLKEAPHNVHEREGESVDSLRSFMRLVAELVSQWKRKEQDEQDS